MPSSVNDLFAAAGAEWGGTVPWGTPVPERSRGVYVVSMHGDPSLAGPGLADAPIDRGRIEELLTARPGLLLDERRPNADQLAGRIASFWMPDETCVYIGLAGTSLRDRVSQYYRTPLGAQRPHAGGWFLKTLSILDALFVHFAACVEPARVEDDMLRTFRAGVSDGSKARLHDPSHPLPFANLAWPPGSRKQHGIRGATG